MKDYGYFGKGTGGYIHYLQAFDDSKKGGGGSNKPQESKGPNWVIIVLIVIGMLQLLGWLLER